MQLYNTEEEFDPPPTQEINDRDNTKVKSIYKKDDFDETDVFHQDEMKESAKAINYPKRTVYPFKMKDMEGKTHSMEEYQGKVLLIVNMARKTKKGKA